LILTQAERQQTVAERREKERNVRNVKEATRPVDIRRRLELRAE
jgi:hypothetical protein